MEARPSKNRKPRPNKPLPDRLASLTDKDLGKFTCVLESNPKDKANKGAQSVATEITFKSDSEEGGGADEVYELDKLTLDQIRKLCRLLGIKYVNNCTKFECRHAIAVLIEYGERRESEGLGKRYNEDRRQNTIFRLTNVVFCHEFFDRFLRINDGKTRADHETRNMAKNFWCDCSDAYNDYEDDECNPAFKMVVAVNDLHFEDLQEADLHDTENLSPDVMRKKVNELFKIRRLVQKNMRESGTHDSDPYNFMEVAIRGCKVSGCPPLAAYYFFMRCEENIEIDSTMQDSLDEEMEGSTESTLEKALPLSSERKRAFAAITEISETSKRICYELSNANKLALERERTNQFHSDVKSRIEIARALDDKEALKEIMMELKQRQQNQQQEEKSSVDDNEHSIFTI